VKVADFGLARAISSATAATATGGVLMGTVSYLPPELVTDGTADARADVYALGVLAFELLTGAKPHTGDSPIQVAYKHVHDDVPAPSTLVGGIPAYLDAFVARATSRQRDLRPADAHVMLHQLRRVKSALEAGVLDDRELTDDLTPTLPVAVSATAAPLPAGAPTADPSRSSTGAADEVFDIATYDDFVPTQIRPLDAGAFGAERTLAVGSTGPLDFAPTPAPAAPRPGLSGYERPPAPPPSRPRRGRGWIALLVVLLLAVGAGGAGGWYGVDAGGCRTARLQWLIRRVARCSIIGTWASAASWLWANGCSSTASRLFDDQRYYALVFSRSVRGDRTSVGWRPRSSKSSVPAQISSKLLSGPCSSASGPDRTGVPVTSAIRKYDAGLPLCLPVHSNRPIVAVRVVSSCNSRKAAVSAVSPSSTCPPGRTAYWWPGHVGPSQPLASHMTQSSTAMCRRYRLMTNAR
jgi:hypothetical protein